MEVVVLTHRRIFWLALAASIIPFSIQAQTTAEMIEQAVLPLPDDLKAGATVFKYDDDSGERIVLRQGSNQVECQPLNEDGFTRCGPTAEGPRRDMQAVLSAEGLSSDDVQKALQKAEDMGHIKARAFGALNYRLYNKDDRIQLLWVVSVPNATASQLGYPTGSQRDNSLAGRGTPWMMREGTSGAHLMIPINGTALSNNPH
jgi:hypothetical protein